MHGRDEKFTQHFGAENLKRKDHSEDRRRWEDNIKTDLREIGWEMWTVYIWLRTGTSEGLS
jgi:hypothetical protein